MNEKLLLETKNRKSILLTVLTVLLFVIFPLFWIGLIISHYNKPTTLLIYEKHISARTQYGKWIDLPITHISIVGKGKFDRLNVCTANGSIFLYHVDKRDEVYDLLIKLLSLCQVKKISNEKSDSLNSDKILLESKTETYSKPKTELSPKDVSKCKKGIPLTLVSFLSSVAVFVLGLLICLAVIDYSVVLSIVAIVVLIASIVLLALSIFQKAYWLQTVGIFQIVWRFWAMGLSIAGLVLCLV